ncbi:C4-dicarboxylate ABC transporter [Marinobacterium nitratireducens]|uniref:C4-dicarboxylate ABC transporter n=1 Tax=Marinobacterium nitratireducens TaxID=518897 RepID=A0A917ZKV4_9GAMM|nr:TRAP transporter substrate-binding protein [Marinobacterium nitratireducens]GGO83865.1 C4-dicarboxylate ABC transporter [Marinobacterium nitratireducens]
MKKILRMLPAAVIGLSLSTLAGALELTVAHVNPPGEASHEAFNELARQLQDSNAGIELKIFPQGQVGGEKDAVEQVQIGAISMTTVANANLSAFAPSVGVFDIPFIFRDADSHPWAVVDGPIGDEVSSKVEAEAGVEVLGWWSAGMRHLFTREKAVESPADLKGQKVRVIGSPVYIDTFNALGAKATPMPYGEVYTGLATGAIDGAENDSSGYRNMRFYEQAPNYTLTGHFFLFKPVVANKAALEALSREQRAEFDRIFADVTAYQRKLAVDNFQQDIETLKSQGVKVVEPDRSAFITAAQPVIDQYAEKFGTDLVQRIIATH